MANNTTYTKIDLRGAAPSIQIYGTFGAGDLTPDAFARTWKALGNPRRVDLFISSPGGDCFAANAIADIIARSGAEITVHIDGLAASMGSYLAMFGKRIIIGAGAQIMIHNPHASIGGGSVDLTRGAHLLESIRVVEVYAKRTRQSEATIQKMMDAETWMDAAEAIRLGFADEVGPGLKLAASAFDLNGRGYRHVPTTIGELANAYWASKGKPATTSAPAGDDASDLVPKSAPGRALTAKFHGKYAGRRG